MSIAVNVRPTSGHTVMKGSARKIFVTSRTMEMARAIAGLGCKVCGVTFPNRQALLKHINKMGHFRDPNEMALPEGMFYIRDSSERPGLLR